jgi:hypothetical protein
MKTLHKALTGALLATSAMIAPAIATAQTTPPPAAESEVGEIVVLGRFIPEPNRISPEVAAFLTPEDLARSRSRC